jgi:acetylornithine deacetylase
MVEARSAWAADVLHRAISIPSVSGSEGPLVHALAQFGADAGLEVDLWQSSDEELARSFGPLQAHKPLVDRPTLVLKLPGTGGGPSIMFNAHSDVVAAQTPARWKHGPWSGEIADGAIFGRGACDAKGPLVSALWAMTALADAGPRPAGDVLLEIVPGEEDCVGLGTLSSIARGYRADAAIILEPTSSIARCASRAGCRFVITAQGRAAHGSSKWLGQDAIHIARTVMAALDEIEHQWDSIARDPLFAMHPIARPITPDRIAGGEWQGMVCDRCVVEGYLELLPGDAIPDMQLRFENELRTRLERDGWGRSCVTIAFPETYQGHRLAPDSTLCAAAESAWMSVRGEAFPEWSGFNAGCEAGVRATLHGTPTLVWGPGHLAQAHAEDEYVHLSEVRHCAEMFARLALHWCGNTEVP